MLTFSKWIEDAEIGVGNGVGEWHDGSQGKTEGAVNLFRGCTD